MVFFFAETISSRKLARASNVTKRFVKMSRRESNLSRTVFLQNRVVSCIFSHQIIDFFYSPIFPPTAKNVAKMPTKKSANANNCRTLNVSKITAIFLQQKCSSHERLTLRIELWHWSHWLQRAKFMNNQSESGYALLLLHPAGSAENNTLLKAERF